KNLATAFAIIIVEFFIDKILLGMGKVFKRILKASKAAIKSTKIGGKAFKALNTARKGVGKVVKAGKGVIKKGIVRLKNTKVVVNLGEVIGKGVKRFNKLRDDILTKFGFKRIWVEKHGKYIELWGDFNPKVLLMRDDGTIEFEELSDVQKRHFGKNKQIGRKLDDPNLPDNIRIDGDNVIVSDAFEQRFNKMAPDDQKKALDNLQSDDFSVRRTEGLKGNKPDIEIPARPKTSNIDPHLQKPADITDVEKTLSGKASKRKDLIEERDLHPKGSEAHNKLNKKVIDESEEIGNIAIDAHAKKTGLGDPVYTGEGAYTVDKIYLKDGKVYVGEAKGGSSIFGGKQTPEGFAQQGTKPYLRQTAKDMIKS
ncbi:MAG: hypothetical protein AAFO82_23910, partial [Bacteroidota bacterium]